MQAADLLRCKACNGNDFDMFCPWRQKEAPEGCLRTARIKAQQPRAILDKLEQLKAIKQIDKTIC